MNIFSGLFFSIQLVCKLAVSAVRIFWSFLGFYGSFLVVLGLAIFCILGNFNAATSGVPRPYQLQPIVASGNKTDYPVNKMTSLPDQIEYWQAQLKKQPTSRDILLNLSMLYQANNEKNLADLYKQKAEAIDPNYLKVP